MLVDVPVNLQLAAPGYKAVFWRCSGGGNHQSARPIIKGQSTGLLYTDCGNGGYLLPIFGRDNVFQVGRISHGHRFGIPDIIGRVGIERCAHTT